MLESSELHPIACQLCWKAWNWIAPGVWHPKPGNLLTHPPPAALEECRILKMCELGLLEKFLKISGDCAKYWTSKYIKKHPFKKISALSRFSHLRYQPKGRFDTRNFSLVNWIKGFKNIKEFLNLFLYIISGYTQGYNKSLEIWWTRDASETFAKMWNAKTTSPLSRTSKLQITSSKL